MAGIISSEYFYCFYTVPELFAGVKRLGDKSVKNSTVWQHGKDIGDYSYAAGYSTISKLEVDTDKTSIGILIK